MKPRIFVGSSVEGLGVAYAIQQNLTHDAEATVWDQGVFEISRTGIESLIKVLNSVDFAVFVCSPDDKILLRGTSENAVRDNVIFELGLFTGLLGRERVFFVVPEGEDIHLPTDLLGITAGKYDANREDESLQAGTGAVCNQIRTIIKREGRIERSSGNTAPEESKQSEAEKTSNWIDHLIRKEYPEARTKLIEEAKGKTGDDLVNSELWQAFLHFKEEPNDGPAPIQAVVSKHSERSSAYCLAASMLSWEGFEKQSKELLEQAYEKFPESEGILIQMASLLKARGDSEGAISILLSGGDSPKPALARQLADTYIDSGQEDAAIEILRASYVGYPGDRELKFQLAKRYLDAKQPKQALALLRALTLESPDVSNYWGYFGNAALMLSLNNTAMAAYRKACELTEENASWILGNIGNLLNNRGFYEDAIKYFHKSLEMEADSQYAHERLASALGNKKKENQRLGELCKDGRNLVHEPSVEA